MADGWKSDKKWSDRFLPEIKMIIGLHLIGEPAEEEDVQHNTDLIVLKMDAVRIACRVRRPEYYCQYPDDVTIRSGRPSGAKTELTKIIEGWGDYFFYGFSDEEEKKLARWKLCRLNAFRLWFNRQLMLNCGVVPGLPKNNKDNSSSFLAVQAKRIPDFVVAEWEVAENNKTIRGIGGAGRQGPESSTSRNSTPASI